MISVIKYRTAIKLQTARFRFLPGSHTCERIVETRCPGLVLKFRADNFYTCIYIAIVNVIAVK